MNIIARYIHSQLTISTVLISFVLVGILWLFVSVKATEFMPSSLTLDIIDFIDCDESNNEKSEWLCK